MKSLVYMKYLKLFEDYSDKTYYHVGLMNIANKSDISYEGSGLSISKHPEEWQKINPLTSGDLFELKKRTPIFFDYYKEKDLFRFKSDLISTEKNVHGCV